ncbi:hypothetical protein PMI08_02779 [Brevibacillus sp. CF112]|nr:hypothetical protein PMI08_02779 [Brevibacillus sp. CF112]
MKSKRWSQYTRVKYPVSSSSLHPFNFFVPIVERVQEGVVSIVTEDAPLAKDVDTLIRSLIDHEYKSTTPTERSFGSGFIFHPRGYILTSQHVIGKSKNIFVKLFNGKVFEAKRIIADRVRDYAVIKIDADCKLYPLPLGNSSHTKVGEWVISVGSPLAAIATKTRLSLRLRRGAPSPEPSGFACCGQGRARTAPDARWLWHTCPAPRSGEKLRVPASD